MRNSGVRFLYSPLPDPVPWTCDPLCGAARLAKRRTNGVLTRYIRPPGAGDVRLRNLPVEQNPSQKPARAALLDAE